ncbi:hypothetical protein KY342_01195, partial [Candidatus Woesearchaeota archaeon]|nr:hypothetical protein [Candidatus Woesearchaeota archaeon]
LNKALLISYGIIKKLIDLFKAKVAAVAAVRAAQLVANQTFVGATIITEANSVAVAKNIALQKGLAASLITTKVALLGIAAVAVGAYMAYRRLSTAQERARRSQIESIAIQMDRQRANLELIKSKSSLAKIQMTELENLKKSGKLTDELRLKLIELTEVYDSLQEKIAKADLRLLASEFRKAVKEAEVGGKALKSYFDVLDKAEDPTRKTAEELENLLGELEKQRNISEQLTPMGMDYLEAMFPKASRQFLLQLHEQAKKGFVTSDEDINRVIKIEKVIAEIIKVKKGITEGIITPDKETIKPDKKLLEDREKLKKKIEDLTRSMNLEILKAYGHEQEAAEKAILNEIEDRELLSTQAKALGLDTTLFLLKTEEWKRSQLDEIRRDQLEKDKKAELERLENQKKAAAEAAKLAKQRAEDISEALGRVTLLKAGAREREQLEVLERNRELRKRLVKAMEEEKEAAKNLLIVKSATNGLDNVTNEKLKERIALIHKLKQAIQDISDFEQNEIQKIQKQWIIDSVNVFMQGAQEAFNQIGYIAFQNERDTQNEIRRIRQEYSTKRVTDETEMLKKIEIAEKNSAIRTANSWKQVFGTMTSTVINSIQSAFMAQAQQALTFAQSLKWSLFGGVVGILGSLFTSWNQSRMREEEQFMGMATSLEEQRRTSFGKISSAPIMNVSISPSVNITGQTIFISGGDVSELETGLEGLIKSTIQRSLDTGELNLSEVATA